MATEQKLVPEQEDHSSAYKMLRRSRQYPQNPSYYKQMKITLRIVRILGAPQHMCTACEYTRHCTERLSWLKIGSTGEDL
jgi:hypothetical protein